MILGHRSLGENGRRILWIPLLVIGWSGLSAAGAPTAPTLPRQILLHVEISPQWGEVGRGAGLRTVFIAPDGLADRDFVGQVLRRIVETAPAERNIEVLIFDERGSTPPGRPNDPGSLRRLRARYVLDRGARTEMFAWVTVEDLRSTPPKMGETPDAIGAGEPWE